MYIDGIRSKVKGYEKDKSGYRPTEHDLFVLSQYNSIGKPDLINNPRLNVVSIEPEGTKIEFILNLQDFRSEFGTRLMLIAIRSNCVIPDLLMPIIPIKESVKVVP
jgi:hypothetical protein